MLKYGIAVVSIAILMLLLAILAKMAGEEQGIDKFHKMCYDVGGLHIAKDGTVIACNATGVIPKPELNKFLEK